VDRGRSQEPRVTELHLFAARVEVVVAGSPWAAGVAPVTIEMLFVLVNEGI
jgi:hypothetical protein